MKLAEMLARQQEIVDAARAAGRGLTTEETREFEQLQRDIDAQGGNGANGGQNDGARGAGNDGGQNNNSGDTQRAIAAERQRIGDIIAIGERTGLDTAQYIKDGATVDAVRAAALEHMVRTGAPVASRTRESEADDFRAAACDALLMRAGVPVTQPNDGVDTMRGMSLRDIAIECMAREDGHTVNELLRMGKDDLWNMACRQFYNPTAAFPAILDNAIKKTIVHQYQHVPTTFDLWTAKGDVTDFKATKDHSYLAGGAGEFLRVGETGELKHDTPKSEMLPVRQIDTYGRQFTMTRQAFINDDIGFLSEVPGMYAAAAKRTINKQVYEIIVKNPAIFDGVKLFDAETHRNLVETGTKPSNEAIQKMFMKLLRQTDPFGDAIMVQPKYIIVPVGYKFLMTTIIASPTINTEGNTQAVNPLFSYNGTLEIIEDGALNALAGVGKPVPWFVAGDPSYAKSIQVDYLNGQEIPTIRRSETPGQLGYVWDIWLDWGITAVDWRGIARNNGAIIED